MSRHRRLPAPRAHWLLLGSVLAVTATLLILHAVTTDAFGADDSPPIGPATAVPAAVASGGPAINAAPGAPPTTVGPADHSMALTFDDGPDPVWTPRILAILDHYHVHATFFVIGSQVVRHPELMREILAHGDEVGAHTFTHVDLRAVGTLRTDIELHATDLALADAAGISTPLVRMPYSAANDSLDNAAWTAINRLAANNRLVIMSTVDSEDWQRPGVSRIVANATPTGQRGEVLLMHDSGGDRAQTVAALDRLIPTLQARGWRLGTVSDTVGLRGSDVPAATGDRVGGALLGGALRAADLLARALSWLLIAATVLAALRTLLVLATTAIHVRRGRPQDAPWPAPVTVIVPAYNEAAGIEATIRSLLASWHPVFVIVVDDGSTDATADIVASLRSPKVWLIRQANAGKAAALNTGLAAARTAIVVMVDGDTVVDSDAVGALARRFADPTVGAVSGNAKVGNRRGLLGRWQHIEYVIGFNLDRRLYDVWRCMPTVPGAIGAFRRNAVLAAGGVPVETLAEDTDLTMAVLRHGWRVVYERDAIAWTEAPAGLGQLWKQRYRWSYGTLQAMWKHRHAVMERGGAGRLGRRGLPYLLLFQVLLPILAPVVDVASLFGVLTGDAATSIVTWLGFLALQAIPGVIAFRLDRERLAPLVTLPLQQLVYRQLMYLVVVQSVATAVAGARLPWHKLERRGEAIPVD